MRIQAALIAYNSPYAAVRAVTDSFDDPQMLCSTIRSWTIGLFFCSATIFINCFFSIRFPSIAISTGVAQLLAYPMGKLMAHVLPDWGITMFGTRHSLNPGPFTKKEHMLATIMAQAAPTDPYSYYVIWIQVLPSMYNQQWARNFGYQFCLTISTSFLGYGIAGILRPLIVEPAYCVFPSVLAMIGLNKAFHMGEGVETHTVAGPAKTRWTVSRLRLFMVAGIIMFVYFWLPNYLFPALSMFSWISWIAPDNKTLSFITGFQSGLGLNPLPTFDWNIVGTMVAPLEIPFWVTSNSFLGYTLAAVFLVGMYLSNYLYTGYLPFNSSQLFDRFGMPYNLTSIINDNAGLDVDAYRAYSLPYMPAGLMFSYTTAFALSTALVAHALLFHWTELSVGLRKIWAYLRNRATGDHGGAEVIDVHLRLMSVYRSVPGWWYLACVIVSLALGLVSILCWPTTATPGAPFFGLLLAAIFIIPEGLLFAMTGTQAAPNLLAEFVGGALVNGNAINMVFLKTYGANVAAQAIWFSSAMKMGHYVKLPPRTVYCAQFVATLISSLITLGIINFQMSLDGVCTPAAPFRFLCRNIQVFQIAAISWGTLGPQRLFGSHGLYKGTVAAFAAGPVLVLMHWGLRKKFPRSRLLHSISPLVILSGAGNWIYTSFSYMWPGLVVAAFSWIYVRGRYLAFWTRVSNCLRLNSCFIDSMNSIIIRYRLR